MDHIKASEASFGQANNYYILMWVMTTLIVVTAFLDFRTHRIEQTTNEQIIKFYGPMEGDAARLAQELRSYAYLAPEYKTERDAIDTIRRQRSQLIARIRGISDVMRAKTDITVEQRVAINKSMNLIGVLLMLNDGSVLDSEFPHMRDTEQLLLAEHSAGSYLLADAIPDLRFEDAVRYHWLATLSISEWLTAFDDLETALLAEEDFGDTVAELQALSTRTMSKDARDLRAFSQKVWTTWITASNETTSEEEIRRRKRLTLRQTSQFLELALDKRTQLALRATGQSSTVTIPVISVPLQLRDAILVAPLLLMFCALSIATYTLRALRYAPEGKVSGKVVGNLPGYYAFYGFSQKLGVGVAVFLLLAPWAILTFVLPAFIPVLLDELDWKSALYFMSCAIALMFLIIPLYMIPRVIELMKQGIAIMSVPVPNFPHFDIQKGRAGAQILATTQLKSIIPSQFVGCWKSNTTNPNKYYLRIKADGRYFISDGRRPFEVMPDGATLDWDGSTWVRSQGAGQTIEGVWDQSSDILTVATDLTTNMIIPGFTLPGLLDTYGNNTGGELSYFEQRAMIVSVTDFGDGTYEATVQAIFGGVSTFKIELKGGAMIFAMPDGDTFEFSSVDCGSLT